MTPSEEQILDRVGAQSFARALRYVLAGALFHLRRHDDTVRARCEGSRGDLYSLSARFDLAGVREARCSCPVGEAGRCKHVAALLIALRRAPHTFIEHTPLPLLLEACTADQLRALVRELVRTRPEIESVLETQLLRNTAPAAHTAPSPRQRAADLFRRSTHQSEHDDAPRTDVAALAHDLLALVTEVSSLDTLERVAALGEVACVIAARSRQREDGAPLHELAKRCTTAIAHTQVDEASRERLLVALFEIYRMDCVERRGPMGDCAAQALSTRAHGDARARVAGWIRAEIEALGTWSRRAHAPLLLELEGDRLDDEAFLALCTEMNQTRAMLRRLVASGKTDAALEIAARATPAELLDTAGQLVDDGHGDAAEVLVWKRVQALPDPRLLDWLQRWCTAHDDTEGMLNAALLTLRAKPDATTLAHVRTLAERLERWPDVWAGLEEFLRTRNPELLCEVRIDSGALAGALEVALHALKPRVPHAVRVRLAGLLERNEPVSALALMQAQAHALIEARGRANYRDAALLVVRMKPLFRRTADAGAWLRYVAKLRESHDGLAALHEELSAVLDARATG